MRLNRDRLAKSSFAVRVGTFLLTLAGLWLPFAAILHFTIKDANTLTIFAMSLLFIEFLVLIQVWGRRVYRESQILRRYGLQFNQTNGAECLQGFGIGLFSLLSIFVLQGCLGWIAWRSPTPDLLHVVLEGGLVGLAWGLGEELLFRGWLTDELQRNYRPTIVLWASSLSFAALHFIKPLAEVWRTLPQFWGLLLLGLALAWAKRAGQGRLGLPIGIHGGLVWGYYIVNVGGLIRYTKQVPEWLTGVNQNPLAGVVGLVGLLILAGYVRWRSHQTQPNAKTW
jgi:uncharacterized protein